MRLIASAKAAASGIRFEGEDALIDQELYADAYI